MIPQQTRRRKGNEQDCIDCSLLLVQDGYESVTCGCALVPCNAKRLISLAPYGPAAITDELGLVKLESPYAKRMA